MTNGDGAVATRQRWSPEEDDQLKHLVGCGWSTRRIAGVLRRPIVSIYRRAARWGGIDALRHRLFAVRSGREMMTLMGVRHATLRLWIMQGWLRSHRGYGKRSRNTSRLRLLVSDEALDDFLSLRDAWTTWDVEDMTDPDWRERARELRAQAGGRWVRTDELAALLGASQRSVQVWAQIWSRTQARPTIKVAERWHVWVGDGDSIDTLLWRGASRKEHGGTEA